MKKQMYVSGPYKKSKAFTLIELLAVIVILAIIALIATPIVLNIIKDSKENAGLRSAEFYLDAVEHSITKKMMDDPTFKPSSCEIQVDGNLKCDDILVKVEISGEIPTSGTINLEKGKITEIELVLGEKTIANDNEGNLVYRDENSNVVFDDDVTFTYYDDGMYVYVLNKCIDKSKIKNNSNYRVTISDVNGSDKTYEVIGSFGVVYDWESEEELEGFVLSDTEQIGYTCADDSNSCNIYIYDLTLNLEGKHHVKVEYIDDNVYPHVLRVTTKRIEIFSTELVEGDATLEIKDSDGGVTNLDTTVIRYEISGWTAITEYDFDSEYRNTFLQLVNGYYQSLQEGKNILITVKQGNNTYVLGGSKFDYVEEAAWECMDDQYYYWGNNKLGHIGGC